MKIVVLGATGNIGSQVVSQALEAGDEVAVLVRSAAKVQARHGLSVVEGSFEDVGEMSALFSGADAVVCAIGGGAKERLLSRLLPGIARGVDEAGSRLVLVSAFGAGSSAAKASWFARLVYSTLVKGVFQDKVDSEAAVLPQMRSPWTVVLPVNLKKVEAASGQAVIPLDEVASVPGLPTLPFANAAAGVLEVVRDPSLNGKQVLITTTSGYRRA